MSLSDQSDSDRVWVVPSNASLQEVLFQWCQEVGWTLLWNSKYGYSTQTNRFTGSFIQAVEALFESMRGVTPGVYPMLYPTNKTMVVNNVR
ncbi:TcpQ domain-containing protein [Rhizobium mongolense]|uniref:TcpQ domain-containing protein n=1 Tax=Rhizobium mongolense TaxID=57676 RepID=UPI003558AC6C